jgi:hypothetical protein
VAFFYFLGNTIGSLFILAAVTTITSTMRQLLLTQEPSTFLKISMAPGLKMHISRQKMLNPVISLVYPFRSPTINCLSVHPLKMGAVLA